MNLHDREEAVSLVKAALSKDKGRLILSKGDVPGHEFHGNQYQDGYSGFGTSTDHSRTKLETAIRAGIVRAASKILNIPMSRMAVSDRGHKGVRLIADSKIVYLTNKQVGLGGIYDKSEKLDKGDVPGHEFHGNQYSGGGEESAEGAAQSKEVSDLSQQHDAEAQYHQEQAEKILSSEDPDTTESMASQHDKAAKYHDMASIRFSEAARHYEAGDATRAESIREEAERYADRSDSWVSEHGLSDGGNIE